MEWKVLMDNARVSRDLLTCGNDIPGVISILGMCLLDNKGDDSFCQHLQWEIARLNTWKERKPNLDIEPDVKLALTKTIWD